jgi:hypothetical protein
VQHQGDDLAADEAAERRTGEGDEDERLAKPLRRVVAGERRRAGKAAGDAEAGEKA